jgi:site-specific recombinase XerD
MRIRVVAGKGKKDRYVALSKHILEDLRAYYRIYQPINYLFNGPQKGRPYSARSIQHILEKTLRKINLDHKGYSIHTLRHSYATHLLEQGTDLPAIRLLLGHSSLSQTMQYVHISTQHMRTVVNPYDTIAQQLQTRYL